VQARHSGLEVIALPQAASYWRRIFVEISVKRSGGFAGVTEDLGTTNTARLAPAVAHEVEEMVRSIDFFNLPATISGGIGADLFRYEITVKDGDREHTVTFADDDSPETAPLLRFVQSFRELR
jgi:hypothetical protein